MIFLNYNRWTKIWRWSWKTLVVDRTLKPNLKKDPNHLIPASYLKPDVNSYIEGLWQSECDKEEDNKLYEILPKLKKRNKLKGKTKNRKEETISTLHIEHSWVSHSFILRRVERPKCIACDSNYTVKHFLIDCSD